MKRVLFISGSLGLGHITRDLAIARELRRLDPEVDISWLASPPATDMIEEAGEKLLPDVCRWGSENLVAEKVYRKAGFHLSISKWFFNVLKVSAQHAFIFIGIMRREAFDLVIIDEEFSISIALAIKHGLMTAPLVPIFDFFGCPAATKTLLENLRAYCMNCAWAFTFKRMPGNASPMILLGEEEDIPDARLGFLLPHSRVLAGKKDVIPVGFTLTFDPEDYKDRDKVRAKLGYGSEPLIIGSIGGLSIGRELLELCGQAYPIAREAIPDLRMVLVCGPRLSATSLTVPEGVEVKGYVPLLYEHFAACDLAIVHGGGTSTLELTALDRPFIFFPLEGHFEQQIHVANRLARHGAGIKLSYPLTTPQILAQHIISNIGKEVSLPSIPLDGTQKAAQIINRILSPDSRPAAGAVKG